MEVDHVIELQVTDLDESERWDAPSNYELLDENSNWQAGTILRSNIVVERAEQVKCNPALVDAKIPFDEVVLDGGSPAKGRWSSADIRAGKHLDLFERLRSQKGPKPQQP
jgi:hypothetical protein